MLVSYVTTCRMGEFNLHHRIAFLLYEGLSIHPTGTQQRVRENVHSVLALVLRSLLSPHHIGSLPVLRIIGSPIESKR